MSGDTIFALATAPGRAAVAVIRLSGPGTAEALRSLAGPLPRPRQASLRRLAGIDEALVLWFPGPASYTGEDSGELHLHGGRSVVEAALVALAGQGLRPAEAGEFTRRAFENGKLDLAQAEAVADLIDAETEQQASQALAQLGGALSRRHEAWRAALIEALALYEAAVDFPDEELPTDLVEGARRRLLGLVAELDAALSEQTRGQKVREGFRIALIGRPNAGKSSLFNALIGRDAAIVTAIPGTTRDVIEAPLTLAGYRVLLADTAGLRAASDVIEAEGVERARRWAQEADMRLWVVDSSAHDTADAADRDLMKPGDLLVLSKADLPSGEASPAEAAGLKALRTAATTGMGLEALLDEITQTVIDRLAGQDFPAVTRLRHLHDLEAARDRIQAARAAPEMELAAEDVRLAARALGRVTGRVDPEDVLDHVFANFCIGK